MPAKTEVFVEILNSTRRFSSPIPGSKNNILNNAGFLNINFKQPPPVPKYPPPNIANNPPPNPARQPFFQQKIERNPLKSTTSTVLLPVKIPDRDIRNELKEDEQVMQEKQENDKKLLETSNKTSLENKENSVEPVDQAVKSPSDLTVTIVPVISVCIVFLIVGVIAVIFRKKIYLGKPKGSKDDIVSKNIYIVFLLYHCG